MGLTIRTAFSIPLFVSNVEPRVATSITALAARPNVVAFDVRNDGNTHVVVGAVHVRGQDQAGSTLFDRTLNGWYVLPSEPRRFNVPLTGAACRQLERVTVDVAVNGQNRPLPSWRGRLRRVEVDRRAGCGDPFVCTDK
jgi:P pilus assembly chaperone PapD